MVQEKMYCIKFFENGAIWRVRGSIAKPLVESGKASFTTKSALKRFWLLNEKLKSNNTLLNKHDFSKDQDKNFLHREEDNGRTYAYLYRKERRRIEDVIPKKEAERKPNLLERFLLKASKVLKLEYEPKLLYTLQEGKVKVVSYPMYQKFLIGVS